MSVGRIGGFVVGNTAGGVEGASHSVTACSRIGVRVDKNELKVAAVAVEKLFKSFFGIFYDDVNYMM